MKMKSALIVFAVTLLITLPTRLYQVFCLTDKKTGFYTDGGATTAIISIVLAVGILLIIVMSYMDHHVRVYHTIRSVSAAVFGTLAGLSLIVESAASLLGGGSSQNHTMYMILSVIGIAAGIVLILISYDFAVGENRFSNYPLLALILPIWGCTSLVALFITYVAVVNVSENIYDTFAVIFLLLFLFAQAKMLAGVENEKSSRMIYVFGIPATLLSLVTGISGVAEFFSGSVLAGYFPVGLHFVNVMMALYVAAFLYTVYRLSPKYDIIEKTELQESQPSLQADSDESGAIPPELTEKKSCWAFLTEAYQSEEKFMERVPSPFNSKS